MSGGTLDHGSWELERAARREAEATAARIARLQTATAALAGARTPDEVADVALGAGLAALGGDRGFVLVERQRGALAVLRTHGAAEAAARLAAASSASTPASECFRKAAPVFVESRASLLARFPRVAEVEGGLPCQSVAAVPMEFEGRAFGVLVIGFDTPRRFGDEDRAFAIALASQSAQALERARLFVAERLARAEAVAARKRLAFLDEVSALLGESDCEAEMVSGLARLSVPALGEWAGVFLTTAGGLDLAAAAGPVPLGRSVEARLRADPLARLARTGHCGEPLVVEELPVGPGGSATSVLLAPLCLKRTSIGAFAIARADGIQRFGEADLSLAADIAHRTALAVEHARLLREATLAAAAREEFLHVASHELRGPLGTLQLTVQLLERDAGKGDSGTVQRRLGVLERQARRLVRLSDMLLDVSRITAGRIELAREPGDLAELVREVAFGFQEEARDNESELRIEARVPVPCAFDAERMGQVVSNLLSNAVKYGGGRPIRVSAAAGGGIALVEVEDRGIGIAPEDQERIFGRFERAVPGRRYPGLGLGLWIARRLVEAHGGVIRVRSAPGEGSTFTVELPLAT